MKFSAAAALAILATGVVATPTTEKFGPNKVPKGFAYTDGEIFRVDGKPFLYAGSNAYWLPFLEVSTPTYRMISTKYHANQTIEPR